MIDILTQEYLKSVFILDEETGWLFWRYDPKQPKNWNTKYAGKPAGGPYVRGYLGVGICGTKYLAHRIIWIYLYGYIPIDVEHKDGNGYNNRPDNLREATVSQNIANADFGINRGIEKHGRKFRVTIWVRNERIRLGSFDTIEEAREAYKEGATQHFGEFAFCNRMQ